VKWRHARKILAQWVSTAGEQQRDRFATCSESRTVKRRCSLGVCRVDRCAGVEQGDDPIDPPEAGCAMQRSPSIVVRFVELYALLDETREDIGTVALNDIGKRRSGRTTQRSCDEARNGRTEVRPRSGSARSKRRPR